MNNIAKDTPLLEIADFTKYYRNSSSLLMSEKYCAVRDISFRLTKGETLAITGTAGAGKSTLIKMVAGFIKPTSGHLYFNGHEITYKDYSTRAKHIRAVFQDPDKYFLPHLNIGQVLDIPLRLSTKLTQEQRDQKIFNTLKMVGFHADHATSKFGTMSHSQKQRIALARALILEPEVLILDNAMGTMDLSAKIQLINLLISLQNKLQLTYIYVEQDLGIIKHIADNVLIMHDGHIIEYGPTKEVFTNPTAELTQRLVQNQFGSTLQPDAWDE